MTNTAKLGVSSLAPSVRLLTPKEASEFLNVPEGTLAQWRSQMRGPAFVKLEGRLVRYRKPDLEGYVNSKIVQPCENP
jgi:excisionase family DNA binding protein